MGDPRSHGLAGLVSNLELYRSMSFLLHDYGATAQALPVCDVSDAQPHQITGPELAVGEVEQRKLAGSLRQLQADTDGPDVLETQGDFCPTSLPLLQGSRAGTTLRS